LQKEYNQKQKEIKDGQKAVDKKTDSTAAPVQPVQNKPPAN
jgi:hypothetical protein